MSNSNEAQVLARLADMLSHSGISDTELKSLFPDATLLTEPGQITALQHGTHNRIIVSQQCITKLLKQVAANMHVEQATETTIEHKQTWKDRIRNKLQKIWLRR